MAEGKGSGYLPVAPCVGMADISLSSGRAGFGNTLAIFLFFFPKKGFNYLYPGVKWFKNKCGVFLFQHFLLMVAITSISRNCISLKCPLLEAKNLLKAGIKPLQGRRLEPFPKSGIGIWNLKYILVKIPVFPCLSFGGILKLFQFSITKALWLIAHQNCN